MRSANEISGYTSRMKATLPQLFAAGFKPLALLTALRRRALNNASMR